MDDLIRWLEDQRMRVDIFGLNRSDLELIITRLKAVEFERMQMSKMQESIV